jgi:hypothetical protein
MKTIYKYGENLFPLFINENDANNEIIGHTKDLLLVNCYGMLKTVRGVTSICEYRPLCFGRNGYDLHQGGWAFKNMIVLLKKQDIYNWAEMYLLGLFKRLHVDKTCESVVSGVFDKYVYVVPKGTKGYNDYKFRPSSITNGDLINWVVYNPKNTEKTVLRLMNMFNIEKDLTHDKEKLFSNSVGCLEENYRLYPTFNIEGL